MTLTPRPITSVLFASAFALGLALGFAGQAQAAAAHVHGQIRLDIAIEGPTVVITMETPLDSLIGFERAPRTDAEKQTVDQAVARLRNAGELFRIDPAANCKLGPVTLHSAALGLGKGEEGAAEGHADLDASFAFNCTNTVAAKFIDVDLFDAFKGARQIEAQIAAPQGQFKRTLRRPATRLAWSK
ncbi:DUF2796 domain-containing protein [Variovorax sp. J22P168]|uniref:DUF2796 domain-containing protein n=1 Tax=Variovorax jilinensis TaxID=3053513 RepID=UPI002577550E|nr:DUF2796 domain-containing protein [Variovorax sp. J22P168]MDM0012760.1 DUF2796 domain-containing protein [Variovorax sp. J22P168]